MGDFDPKPPKSKTIGEAEIQHMRLRHASRSVAEHRDRQLDAERGARARNR